MTERWAVVTGASRGIGEAIAIRLAADGFGVLLVATNAKTLEPVRAAIEQAGGQAEVRPCDLADRKALAELAAVIRSEQGAIHALINCAGIVRVGPVAAFGGSDWDDVVEVNLRAAFELCRTLEPAMRAAAQVTPGGSSIVNISSVMGLLATPGIISYVATKGALDQLTRGLAVEFGPGGIRVNSIAPGFIRTSMFEAGHPPERKQQLGLAHPLGRVGTVEEIAAVVAFLCSTEASFINGAVIPVDGGLTARMAVPSLVG